MRQFDYDTAIDADQAAEHIENPNMRLIPVWDTAQDDGHGAPIVAFIPENHLASMMAHLNGE